MWSGILLPLLLQDRGRIPAIYCRRPGLLPTRTGKTLPCPRWEQRKSAFPFPAHWDILLEIAYPGKATRLLLAVGALFVRTAVRRSLLNCGPVLISVSSDYIQRSLYRPRLVRR